MDAREIRFPSLMGQNPDFQYLMTQMTNFIYSNSLIASEGSEAMDQLFDMIGNEYILAVEGAVSRRDNGLYHIIGRHEGKEVTGLEAAIRAGGTCLPYHCSWRLCILWRGISGKTESVRLHWNFRCCGPESD